MNYNLEPQWSAKPETAVLPRTMLADLAAENIGNNEQAAAPDAPPPTWDVFARAAYDSQRASEIGGS
jgi:hypothetical protein